MTTESPQYSRQCYHMLVERPWCIYTHSFHGEIFYVGQGHLGRPFDASCRNPRWHRYVREIGSYTITIVEYFATSAEARKAEMRLLTQYSPFCNLDMRGVKILRDNGPQRDHRVSDGASDADKHLVGMMRRIHVLEQRCQQLELALCNAKKNACSPVTWWQQFLKMVCKKRR